MKFNIMILISFMVLILSLTSVSAIDFGHSAMTVSHSEGFLDVDNIYEDVSVAESHAADKDAGSLLVEDSLSDDDSVLDEDAAKDSCINEDSLTVDDSVLDEDISNDGYDRHINDFNNSDIINDGSRDKNSFSDDSIISILNDKANPIVLVGTYATFDDLQSLIDNSPAGTVLKLSCDYTSEKNKEIILDKDLTIDGQGHTIDCKGLCRAITSSAGNIILRNLNFINGYIDGLFPIENDFNGGSIWIRGSATYTIENCLFKSNYADDYGGAIYSSTIDPTLLKIRNCTFESNNADDYSGGAIYVNNGELNIENSVFRANSAYKNGGAIHGPYINISNTLFEGNTALDSGGAIFAFLGLNLFGASFNSNLANVDGGAVCCICDVVLFGCNFDSNQAFGSILSRCDGGAVCAYKVVLDGCVFRNNLAENHGGAIYADGVNICNTSPTVFEGNTALKGDGGAICTSLIDDLKFVTFYNNTAAIDGGAIYTIWTDNLSVSQCSIVANHAGDEGGFIYLDATYALFSLVNNVIVANTASDGHVAFNKGSYAKILNNWWGDANPSYDNHVLVEWFTFFSNKNRIDSDPLRLTIDLDKNIFSLAKLVTVTAYFIKSDGSRFLGQIPTKDLKFILPDGTESVYDYKTQNSAVVVLLSSMNGIYHIAVNLHGQFAYVNLINGDISKENNIIPQRELFTFIDCIESLFESFQMIASLTV